MKIISLHRLFLVASSFLIFNYSLGLQEPPVPTEPAALAEPTIAPEVKPGVMEQARQKITEELKRAGLPLPTREELEKMVKERAIQITKELAQKGIKVGLAALKRKITGQVDLPEVIVIDVQLGVPFALRSQSGRFLADDGKPQQLDLPVEQLPDSAKWKLLDPADPDKRGPIKSEMAADGLCLQNVGTGRYLKVEGKKVTLGTFSPSDTALIWKISDLRGISAPLQLKTGWRVNIRNKGNYFIARHRFTLGTPTFLVPPTKLKKFHHFAWVFAPVAVPEIAPPVPPTAKERAIEMLQKQLEEIQAKLRQFMAPPPPLPPRELLPSLKAPPLPPREEIAAPPPAPLLPPAPLEEIKKPLPFLKQIEERRREEGMEPLPLKPVEKVEKPKTSQEALMEEIRKGKELKKTEPKEIEPKKEPPKEKTMEEALQEALAKRRAFIKTDEPPEPEGELGEEWED